MLYIQSLLKNIAAAHENFRAKVPSKARFGIIALLAVISFIILIFAAEWLMAHMIALLPVFYVSAVLAVGFKRALYGTAIFLCFCFALWLRVGPPHEGVLGGSYVLFAENDGWYNARLIENLVHHFPFRNSFDPYTLYPYGQEIPFAPFFDWSIALIIWVAGLGHPSADLIEKMSAYFPAVLGALTIIPVYFIGKELFNRNAGLLAAGLLAILPGEFLFRSILGFTDHHIAEALFSTTTMLFFIMAIKRAQESQITFSQIKNREWRNLKKPLLFAILAGFSLGIYILSWIGAAVFIFIILAYVFIQYILDHLSGKSTDYLTIISIPILLIALLISAIFYKYLTYGNFVLGGLFIGLLGVAVFQITSYLMARRNIRRIFYPVTIAVIAGIGVGLLYLIWESLYHDILSKLSTLVPIAQTLTIMEAQPLLSGLDISHLTDHRVWSYFTTGLIVVPAAFLLITYSAIGKGKMGKWFFLSWIGILVLTVIIDQMASMPWQIYLVEGLAIIALYVYFEKSSARIILLIWSFVTLLALLSQTRYAYYYAINVALLSSYILWKIPQGITQILALLRWKDTSAEDTGKTRAEKRRAKAKEQQPAVNYLRPKYVAGVLSIVIIFFLTIYPNLIYGTFNDSGGWSPKNSATLFLPYHPYGPNGDWHEALTWMKDNTPDPFEDPDFYYELYDAPKTGELYDYPDSAYGVMSWWDYGHWITRIARRIPNANPFQAGIGGISALGNPSENPGASTFMTAQDEATASGIMDELGSKYVVIDIETAYGKYHTMVTWSGGNVSDYYEMLYIGDNGEYRTYDNPGSRSAESQIFYPSYYQSMCARLYNFGTAAVVPNNSTFVVLFAEETDENGEKYKYIADVANDGSAFSNYEEAQQFLNDHPGYTIVGLDPFSSPIPLEALTEYELIHSSPSIVTQRDNRNISYVEVFEYTGYK
ncbi:MAG: oligosaccharyl transferase, archaeosortase A system-associated [Dehalococcoidia bacterium]|jgi:dolichyl-diphosphooligosaccharide--protein glycosyltransferase